MSNPFDDIKADVTGKNGDRKRNTVIAVGTVVLVILTYLLYKRSQSAGAAGASTGAVSGDTSGVTGDSGAPTDQSLQSLANAISAETGILAAISARIKTSNAKLRNLNKREAKTNTKLNHILATEKKGAKHKPQTKPSHPHKKGGSMRLVVHPPPKKGK